VIAVGIGLAFPTLMAAATADVPASDAGIVGGVANTASQAGGSIGLAVLATAAATGADGSSPAALADGYDLVFLIAAGLALTIALLTLLLPRCSGRARGAHVRDVDAESVDRRAQTSRAGRGSPRAAPVVAVLPATPASRSRSCRRDDPAATARARCDCRPGR
jgi:MFS family permease